MPTGTQLIRLERRRQLLEEKWSPKHDAEYHPNGELSNAADCYERCARFQEMCGHLPMEATDAFQFEPINWPWEPVAFKLGGSAVRTYVKAGALFQAEIDRIEKLFKKSGLKKTTDIHLRLVARAGRLRIAEALDRLLK